MCGFVCFSCVLVWFVSWCCLVVLVGGGVVLLLWCGEYVFDYVGGYCVFVVLVVIEGLLVFGVGFG